MFGCGDRERLALDLGRPAGEVARGARPPARTSTALGELDRLAVVERLELGELVGVRLDQRRRARASARGARRRRILRQRAVVEAPRAPPRPRGRRPRRPPAATSAIALAGGRVERLEGAPVGGVDPLAADQQACGPATNARAASERASGRAEAVVMPPKSRSTRAQLDAAQRVELEPHACRPGGRRGAGRGSPVMMRIAGAEVLVRGRQAAPDRLDHGLQVARRSSAGAITCSTSPLTSTRAAAGRVGLHARAEGDRPVEDVARRGSSRRPGRGRAGRRSRAPAAARRSSAPSSPSSTATSGSATDRPVVAGIARRRPRAGRRVVRKPASGASMPSFSWTAEHVEADLPADRLGALRRAPRAGAPASPRSRRPLATLTAS